MPTRPSPFQTIPAPLSKALWSALALTLVPCLGACINPRPTQELIETSRFLPLTSQGEVWNYVDDSYAPLRSPPTPGTDAAQLPVFQCSVSPLGTRWAIQRSLSDFHNSSWEIVRDMGDGSVRSFIWNNVGNVQFISENWVVGRRPATPHWQHVIRHASGDGGEVVLEGRVEGLSIGDDGSTLWSDGESCFVGNAHDGQWRALNLSAVQDGWKSSGPCVIVPGVALVITQGSDAVSAKDRIVVINASTGDTWIFPDMYPVGSSPDENGLIACRRHAWPRHDRAMDWLDVSQWPPRVARSCTLPLYAKVAVPSADGTRAFGYKDGFFAIPHLFGQHVLYDLSGPTAHTYRFPSRKHDENAGIVGWIRADMREQQDDSSQKDTQSKASQSSTTH